MDAAPCLPESWRTRLPTPQDMKEWLDAQTWAGPLASRSEAFASLCKLWNEQKNWPDFFAQLSLLRDTDMVQSKAEVVQLMTLHAAKGLEFRAVFLPGLEDGLLPLRRQLLFGDAERETTDEAEERRLLYVGLTRASQGIFASHAASRTLFGKRLSLAPSPFLPCIREFCHQSTLVRREQKTLEQGSLL